MLKVPRDQRAQTHLLAGIVKFISEKVPYSEVKEHLKGALIETESLPLKGLIGHNLAVINYCEIQDHNDRVLKGGGDYLNSEEAEENMSKHDAQRS